MFGLFVQYCQYYVSKIVLLLAECEKAGIGTSIPFPPQKKEDGRKNEMGRETNLENGCKHV